MPEQSPQKTCPNCKSFNDLDALSCTFCGYVFGSKPKSQNVSSIYRNSAPEKKWTLQQSNLGPGGKGSEEGLDGTNLSWADNQNLGWANLDDGEEDPENEEYDAEGNPQQTGHFDPNAINPDRYKKKVIGLCMKCGRNLYDTRYQQESIEFLEKNKIRPNFHKYIKNGMMMLCPRCLRAKLIDMQRRQ